MKNGVCPRCHAQEVYSSANIRYKTGNSSTIPLSFLRSIPLDNYVCINCGYVESYVADQDMLSRVKDIWTRIEPGPISPPQQ